MKTSGSVKVTHDRDGQPWLIVGTADGGYEAQRVVVIERHQFVRSWQAVRFADDHLGRREELADAAENVLWIDHRDTL